MEENNNKNQGGNGDEMKKLNVMGDTYITRYTRKYEDRKQWTKPDEKQLLSFIPGTIREILVKEGEKVSAGQKLLVLEAMKMKNSIKAPFDGKIKSVKVSVGDCVPKGTLMVEFE